MISLNRSKSANGVHGDADVLSDTEVVARAPAPAAPNGPAAVKLTDADRAAVLARVRPVLPDLADAISDHWVSFEELADVHEGMDDPCKTKRKACRQIYPLARDAFEASHGRLIHFYQAPEIRAYVARTAPTQKPGLMRRQRHRPGFYFWYDMATCPIASHLYARITQLAHDANTVLNRGELAEFLNQLYSATTDLLRIVEGHPAAAPSLQQERLAVVKQELDRIELRYLQVTARLRYFTGVVAGTGATIIGALVIGANTGIQSIWLTTAVFAALGAMLSVVQKITDDSWTVRYVVGGYYVVMLGFLRPLIGAAAGFLLQLAIAAGIIPLSTSGAGGNSYILLAGFAVGFSEKAIPDIFSRTGLGSGIPAAPSPSVMAAAGDATQSPAWSAPHGKRSRRPRG